MLVKDALVNTGQFGMMTGFRNSRLPNCLGPCWKTEGGFAFSFQISFRLDEVDPAQIKLVRKTSFQTLYHDPTGLKQLVKDILNGPLGAEDSPNEQNVKREEHRNHKGEICGGEITVWDAPGPMPMITQNAIFYPIEFRGRFEVQVIHEPTVTKLYSIEYLVGIRATAFRGAITPCTAFPQKRKGHGCVPPDRRGTR
ncbi:MAG: hypothetical protein WA324_20935 [Bryobacteraceae bacterium]